MDGRFWFPERNFSIFGNVLHSLIHYHNSKISSVRNNKIDTLLILCKNCYLFINIACFRPTVSPRPLGAFTLFFEPHVFYGRFSKTSSYLKWFTTGYNFVHFFSRNILVWCHEIARWFWSRLHSLLWYSPYSTLVTIEFSNFTF